MCLQVNEIFTSLSGEPDAFGNQGGLATFVRLQGCNLKCDWCDTNYATEGAGQEIPVVKVFEQCVTSHIILTGGEPLLQREAVKLLVRMLVESGQWVTIETNGTQMVFNKIRCGRYTHWRLPPVRYVVDYKLYSSEQTHYMKDHVFDSLTCFDMIKFVIADEGDYFQAVHVIKENPHWQSRIVFSPAITDNTVGTQLAEKLAKRIISDRLEFVQFSMQLHKLVNIK